MKTGKRRSKDRIGYLLIAPSYLIYIIFILIPMVTGIYFSFTNYDMYKTNDFIGLQNYRLLLQDELFIKSIGNTFIYSVSTIIPTMVIGILLAVVLNGNIPGKGFFKSAMYVPNVTSMVAISMIWLWIYEPSMGILNRMMNWLGLPMRQWLYEPGLAMLCVIIMSIWKGLGYNMIINLAGLQSIPINLYEAAEIDGANKIQQFFRITLPMLRPTTFFLFVTSCINSFNVFEQVNIMTSGGPLNSTTTIVHQIYLQSFRDFRMGYASAMSVVLLLIVIGITLLNFKYGNQGNDLDVN